MSEAATQDPVYARLLKAALECFLADEYHKVTTRMIAEKADANVSMIRYYFANKEGLYEEMIRVTIKPLLDLFDGSMTSEVGGIGDFLRLSRHHAQAPRVPKAYSQGTRAQPGTGQALHPAAAGARTGERCPESGGIQGPRSDRCCAQSRCHAHVFRQSCHDAHTAERHRRGAIR